VVSLGASTPVACSGISSTTIGAMLSEVDARLVALEGQSLADNAVRAAYSVIIACLDAINNGRAFPNVCPSTALAESIVSSVRTGTFVPTAST
jgi:hypothetical protein